MGPKKKNKTNKLARMSEEERLRYLQHRAAMEEEAQRRKQELITTYLKTKLKHEEAFTRLNSSKINQQWRQILRQIKCKELKEDVEILKQRSEMVIECKNKIIENLLLDFDYAEFQYSLQFKSHMESISKLFEIHKSRIADLHNWYLQQLKELLEKTNANKNRILTDIGNDMDELQTTWKAVTNKSEDNLRQMKVNFSEKNNELQTKLLYKMVKLEEKYADKISEMKQKLDNVLLQYKNNTDTKQAHYKILAQKDDSDSLQIIRHFEEISKYTERIERTQSELDEMEKRNCEESDRLRVEKEKVAEKFQKLQKESAQNWANDQKQLKILVNVSNGIIRELSILAKKGDKILHLAENCHKLQSTKASASEEILDFKAHDKFVSPYQKLQNFWTAFNEAKITNETLQSKELLMGEENKKLKKLLRTYMTLVRRSSSVPRKCGF